MTARDVQIERCENVLKKHIGLVTIQNVISTLFIVIFFNILEKKTMRVKILSAANSVS